MKPQIAAADPAVLERAASCAISAASGLCAWLVTVKGLALELLGVPLPVVLAAASGAFGARLLLAEAPFWRALGASCFWTLGGSYGVQFVLWLASAWIAAASAPPNGALAGGALTIAGVGQFVGPRIPELVRAAVDAFKRRLDRVGRPGSTPRAVDGGRRDGVRDDPRDGDAPPWRGGEGR